MLSTKNILLSLSLIFTGIFTASAQVIFTMDSVFKRIEKNNPELKIYDEQVKQQDALIDGANAWKAPMVGIGTFMTPYNNFNRNSNLRDGSFMITAEQEILNKSKKKSETDYLAAQSAITIAQKANNLNELKSIARTNYYEAILEEKRLDFINQDIEILTNLKKLAKIRYTYNKADLAQIYSLDAKTYEAQNKLTTALANIHIAKIRLNVLMNRPYNSALKLDTSIINSNYILVEDIENTVANTSLLKKVEAELNSVKYANQMIANEAKPNFNISFNHMLTYNNMMPNQFSLMAGVSIPIAPWAAKSYKSKLKANEFEQNALQQQKENLQNNLAGMIKSQEQHLTHLKTELEVYQTHIFPALKSSYEVTLLNYQENKANLSAVLESWKAQNEAQMDYLTLFGDFFKMYVEYEKNVERNEE